MRTVRKVCTVGMEQGNETVLLHSFRLVVLFCIYNLSLRMRLQKAIPLAPVGLMRVHSEYLGE